MAWIVVIAATLAVLLFVFVPLNIALSWSAVLVFVLAFSVMQARRRRSATGDDDEFPDFDGDDT